ncbi:MAG TPA: hypothetical protein PKC13_30800 [Blastocatellia bacterium]|nr:hypothetical protein [Blastocatellia bacterium]
MAKINMPDGQSFELEDEMAASDDSLRAALKVAYPDAANATFERSGGKDGKPLVVKVVKKAGTKGLGMSADEFNKLFDPGTPVSHPLDCLCRACQAFIAAGLELRDARAAEAA